MYNIILGQFTLTNWRLWSFSCSKLDIISHDTPVDQNYLHYIPRNEVGGGLYWNQCVCLFGRPSVVHVLYPDIFWNNFADNEMKVDIIAYNNGLQIKFEFRLYWAIFVRVMTLGLKIFIKKIMFNACKCWPKWLSIFTFFTPSPLPVRIRVRIDPPHPHVCRKRRLNGVVLQMRPEKPRGQGQRSRSKLG
jgi:hypothetical protein